jgi:hypothetical protein
MSVLMPLLSKVKSQAKSVLCRQRLSQWGVILKLFTEDNGGFSFEELWELHWYKNWYNGTGDTPDYSPPDWPDWMVGMKDFAMVVD